MSGFTGGATLLLGSLLFTAGAMKLAQPRPFAHAVQRLLPRRMTTGGPALKVAAATVGATEVFVGVGLLGSGWWPSGWSTSIAAASAGLYLAFVAAIVVAVHKGAACGCWSSFSDGPAGAVELGRALALAGLAAAVVVADVANRPSRPWEWSSLPWAAFLAAAVAAVAGTAGYAWRAPRREGRGSAALRPLRPGVRGLGAFLLGQVSSRKADVSPLSRVPLPQQEHERIIATARSLPSVRAFENWLGDTTTNINWDSAVVSSSTVHLPHSGRVHCVVLTPPATESLTINVSMPMVDGQLADGVVVGTLNGIPVAAFAGGVRPGPQLLRERV